MQLQRGTPAGVYHLVLEAGELVDWESSRAINPVLAGGALTVLEEVRGPDVPPPPPPPDPSVNRAAFNIGSGLGAPGDPVSVPFSIWVDFPIQGYQFSVDFDETVLPRSLPCASGRKTCRSWRGPSSPGPPESRPPSSGG